MPPERYQDWLVAKTDISNFLVPYPASFSFAVLMTVVVNGSMLMTFDSAAQEATLAQSTQVRTVAVMNTVTIVGRRI